MSPIYVCWTVKRHRKVGRLLIDNFIGLVTP